MAQVIKGTIGSGFLWPGQTTWWNWKITWGDVWHFWVDTAQMSHFEASDMEIVRVINRRQGTTNRAYIQIRNPGNTGTTYYLRVARIV